MVEEDQNEDQEEKSESRMDCYEAWKVILRSVKTDSEPEVADSRLEPRDLIWGFRSLQKTGGQTEKTDARTSGNSPLCLTGHKLFEAAKKKLDQTYLGVKLSNWPLSHMICYLF